MRAAYYPKADRKVQDYSGKFSASPLHPNVVTLHSTEGVDWPDYDGGSMAPNLTLKPIIDKQQSDWRQHFRLDRSSRALVNLTGGVETNTLNVDQVEIVGTCDPKHKRRWGDLRAGKDYLYLPDMPDWLVHDISEFLAFMHTEWALNLAAPKKWPAYPESYGAKNGCRMTDRRWNNFYGVCGHMHVPENDHGDPGNIPIDKILAETKQIVSPPKKPGRKPKEGSAGHHTTLANNVYETASKALDLHPKQEHRNEHWQTIQDAAAKLSKRY